MQQRTNCYENRPSYVGRFRRLDKKMKIRDLLRNENVQTIILMAIIIAGIAAFWFGLRFAFQTEFPLLAVASGSMEPVFYRGDLIIVQGGLNFTELNAAPKNAQRPGEIIVFYDPRYDRAPIYLPVAGEARLIVHRAISKVENNGTWYFQTKGDHNIGADHWSGPETWKGKISEKLLVGKVVGKVPWLGHVPLFMHENSILAALIIGFLVGVLIIVDFIFSQKGDEKTRGQEEKLLNTAISKKVHRRTVEIRKIIDDLEA